MNDIFTKTYLNIITELIDPGRQSTLNFPKLNELGFYKINFRFHSYKNDAERDVTKGNSNWLYNLIDDNISNALSSNKYEEYFKQHDNVITFSIFTEYYGLTQIPVEVNLNEKLIELVTLIPELTIQRYQRLTSKEYFYDSKGRFNIPIKA